MSRYDNNEYLQSEKPNFVALISLIMFVLTIINIGFTYFIVDYKIKENEIKNYGNIENYQKALIVNEAQYRQAFGGKTVEEVKKDVEAALGGADGANHEAPKEIASGDMTKEDLVANTPIYGKADAKFSVYEFSDLECPYCQNLHKSGVIKDAVDKNPENLNYVYRNFQFHNGAPMKAQAALCAVDLKGEKAFFDMIDSIFNDSLGTTKDDILAMGEKLGISKTDLETCIDSGKYSETLQKDYNLGISMGVTGTPSVFVVNNETGEFKRLESRSIEGIESLMN